VWRVLIACTVVACGKGAKAPAKPAEPVTVAPGIVRTEPGHYALTVARKLNPNAAPIKMTFELSPRVEQRIRLDTLLESDTGEPDLWPNVVVNINTDNLPPGGARDWYTKSIMYRVMTEDTDDELGKRKVVLRESLPDRDLVSMSIFSTNTKYGQYYRMTCMVWLEEQGCAIDLVAYAGPADQALLKDYEASCKSLRVVP